MRKSHEKAQFVILNSKQAIELKANQIDVVNKNLTTSQETFMDKEVMLVEMESVLVGRDVRQQMLNDEIARAKAQIDLINNALLQVAGL